MDNLRSEDDECTVALFHHSIKRGRVKPEENNADNNAIATSVRERLEMDEFFCTTQNRAF